MTKAEARRIRRCYHSNGKPKRCPDCISPDLREDVRDSLDVGVGCIPMEVETLCNKCGSSVAYWAHGYYYDPTYLMDKLGIEY